MSVQSTAEILPPSLTVSYFSVTVLPDEILNTILSFISECCSFLLHECTSHHYGWLRLVEEARGTKTKTSAAASHVFLPCCWCAPAMPTAPIWLLISFSTFVPHQYSDVVGHFLSIADGANCHSQARIGWGLPLYETRLCIDMVAIGKHGLFVNDCILLLFTFHTAPFWKWSNLQTYTVYLDSLETFLSLL